MDRGAWQATVHGIPRVGHDLATKPRPPCSLVFSEEMRQVLCLTVAFSPHGFCFLPSFLHKLDGF